MRRGSRSPDQRAAEAAGRWSGAGSRRARQGSAQHLRPAFQTIGGLGTTSGLGGLSVRKSSVTAEVVDLLRSYPRKRLQLHVLDLVLAIFRKMLGNTPEYLREINFCRSTLADMHAALAKAVPTAADSAVTGKLILPDGCKDLDEAADQFLAGLAPEDLLAFEQALQKEVSRKFKGLGSVCLKPLEKGGRVSRHCSCRGPRVPRWQARPLRPGDDLLPLPHGRRKRGAPDRRGVRRGDPRARSRGAAQPEEITIAGCSARFRRGSLPRTRRDGAARTSRLTAAPLPDDICFYREYPQLDLADLPQLGDYAREAYVQMAATDHPPHSLRYLLAAARLTTAGYPFGRAAQILFFPLTTDICSFLSKEYYLADFGKMSKLAIPGFRLDGSSFSASSIVSLSITRRPGTTMAVRKPVHRHERILCRC